MIDAFLKLVGLDGKMVEGESTDRTLTKLIEIRDFGLGDKPTVSPPAAGDAPEAGPPTRTEAWSREQAAETDARLRQIVADRDRQSRNTVLQRQNMQQMPRGSTADALAFVRSRVEQQIAQHEQDSQANPDLKRMKFSIVKDIDAASADLFQASCATAKAPQTVEANRKMGEFASATVTLRKMFAGEAKPYLVCTFRGVAIDSYTLLYDKGRAHLYERVSFVFEDYTIDYRLQTAAGGLGAANPIKEGSLSKKSGS